MRRPSAFSSSDDPADSRGWARGRKFSSEDLQLMLLGLLEENPSHGYELIKALDARSSGFYVPSPGMVYPALAYLEDMGYASVAAEGSKKRYRLTEPGRAHLEARRERLAQLFGTLTHVSRKMIWMRRAWAGEPPVLDADGIDHATGWLPELVQARLALKEALLRADGAGAQEQRRLAAILVRAASEIEAGACP